MRAACTTAGDPQPSTHSRAVASPGMGSTSSTASDRARKQPALPSRIQHALLRRGELCSTAATVGDQSQEATAVLLADRDPAVAVVSLVAHVAGAQHADRASDLLVLRLDEEEPLKSAVLGDRHDDGPVAGGPGHPATPGAGERGGLGRARLGGRAADREHRREEHDGASESPGRHATRVYQACRSLTAPQSAMRLTPKTHTIVAPVGKSSHAEAVTPSTLTTVPKLQPTSSRVATEPPTSVAASAGTMRYENTSSTPAIRTELVTTTPNDA